MKQLLERYERFLDIPIVGVIALIIGVVSILTSLYAIHILLNEL